MSVLSLVSSQLKSSTGGQSSVTLTQDTSILTRLTTEYFKAVHSRQNPSEIIDIIEQILDHDPGSSTFWFYLGLQQKLLYEFNPAIDAFLKSMEISAASSVPPVVQVYDYYLS